jgi:YD repeat-containing protein
LRVICPIESRRIDYILDANGNTLSGKSYSWDFENRLVSAVVPGTGTVTFKYDPFGRRIQKSGPLGTTISSMTQITSSRR